MAKKQQPETEPEIRPQQTDAERLEAEKKSKALTDYEKHLEKVLELKAMTDTDAWQGFYVGIKRRIQAHAEAVLDAEKTREVVQHQEGVKVLKDLIERVKRPVEELNSFVFSFPLFAQDMKTRAEWNDVLGRVELKGI